MPSRLEFATEAAWQAGRLTLAHFQQVVAELKADNTPVTIADREAEAHIRKLIAREFPGEGILGEEEGSTGDQENRWVIDPIDGTKSFVAGVPLYATLLSYEEGGEPIVAACVLPALGDTFYAEKGNGAFWNGRRIQVDDETPLSRAILCTGSHGSLHKYGLMEGVIELTKRTMATRTWGDAYGHMLVASGRTQAMIEPIVNHWDISSVALIVREAGGSFSDLDGNDTLGVNALSCPKGLKQELLEALRA